MIIRWLGSGTLGGFSHVTARDVIIAGYKQAVGGEPNLNEQQILQAVAWGESNYGAGWKGHPGVNNWGAVQAGKPPCNPETSFLYTDTHPTSSGGQIPYSICFRKYPSPQDGAAHFIKIMYKMPGVKEAAVRGDIKGVSTAMYNGHYYEGFGTTREARIANHVKMLTANVKRIADANGESMPSPDKAGGGWLTTKNVLIAGIIGALGWGIYKRGGLKSNPISVKRAPKQVTNKLVKRRTDFSLKYDVPHNRLPEYYRGKYVYAGDVGGGREAYVFADNLTDAEDKFGRHISLKRI